jgi:hypothetical protein
MKRERRYPLRLDAYAGRYVPGPAASRLTDAERAALEVLLRRKQGVSNRSARVRVNSSRRVP